MASPEITTLLSVGSAGVVCAGVGWNILKDVIKDRRARRLAADGRVAARVTAEGHDAASKLAFDKMMVEFGRLADAFEKHDRECIGFKAALTEMIKAMKLTLDRHDRLIENHASQIRASMTGGGNKRITVQDDEAAS